MSPSDLNRRDLLKAAAATAGVAVARTSQASTDSAAADIIVGSFNRWLSRAQYVDGQVQGVMLSGGYLQSDVQVGDDLAKNLETTGLTAAQSAALAQAATEAWESWYADWSLPTTEAFPEFAAAATPEVPTTMARPVKLQPTASRGFSNLRPALLAKRSCDLIKEQQCVNDVVHDIAWIVGQRVAGWEPAAMVEGIHSGGSVPTFAPPYVPVGPVVGVTTPSAVTITPIP